MPGAGKSVLFDGTETEYRIEDGMSRIGDLQFAGADRLERLYIPDSVTQIGKYAFMNCYSLKEIRMPVRVVRIGAGLFQNCWQLRSIRMPEGAETLGTDMFENCHALEELWLPLSLKEAARTSLSGCRSLKIIHISPQQLGILPPSARYTAAITFMEEHPDCAHPGSVSAGSVSAETDPVCAVPGAMRAEADALTDKSSGGGRNDFEMIDSYVSDRQKSFLDLAINRRSSGAVRYMINHGLLSEDALREYLDKSAAASRVEITALILNSLKDTETSRKLSADPFV